MINYKRTCLAVLALLCLEMYVNIGMATAQVQTVKIDSAKSDDDVQNKSLSVSVQPFFLLNNAGKFDVELQQAGSKFGYVFTAEVYSGRIQDKKALFDNSSRIPYDQISGIGIGISQKYKFKTNRSSPYAAYGATYRYQEIAIETEGFYPYQENGLTFYDYGPLEKNLVISSALISGTIGYQKISDDFLYDFYMGLGYKAQLKKPDFGELREYDSSIVSYAYKGFAMVAGFKIGFQFR